MNIDQTKIVIPDRLVSSSNGFSVEGVCIVIVIRKSGIVLTLSVLEVFKEYIETLALYTIVLDNDARAAHDLAGIAFLVDLAKTCPSAQDLAISDLDQVDFVL